MDPYQPNTYGERIAGIYDDLYTDYDPAHHRRTRPAGQDPRVQGLRCEDYPG